MPFEQKAERASSGSSSDNSSSSASSSSSTTGGTSGSSSSGESSDNSTDSDIKNNSVMGKKSSSSKKTSPGGGGGANAEKLTMSRGSSVASEKVPENIKLAANDKTISTKSYPTKKLSAAENDKKTIRKDSTDGSNNKKLSVNNTNKNTTKQRVMPTIKAEIYSDSSDSDDIGDTRIKNTLAIVKTEKPELPAPKLTQQRTRRRNSKSSEDTVNTEQLINNNKTKGKLTGSISKTFGESSSGRNKSATPPPPKLTPIKDVSTIVSKLNKSKPSPLSRATSSSSSSESSYYSPPIKNHPTSNGRSITELLPTTKSRCKCKYNFKSGRQSDSLYDSSCDSKCDSECGCSPGNYDKKKVSDIDQKPQIKKEPLESKPTVTVNNKVRTRGRPRKRVSPPPKQTTMTTTTTEQEENNNLLPSGDKIVTRKQTRSTISNITRVSKLLSVTGNTSDSDSSIGVGGKSVANMYGFKKMKPLFPKMSKNGKDNPPFNNRQLVLLEEPRERSCPVEGCDSSGHLNGILEKHFTTIACPFYHNLTPKLCQEYAMDREKKLQERQKLVLTSSNIERKAYRDRIREQCAVEYPLSAYNAPDDVSEAGSANTEKEPELSKCNIPPHHLQLFRDAQAANSEIIEEELKTLPNVKGTKYIEIGSHQMEVWYQSPYPDEFTDVPKLYICEYCLGYMKTKTRYNRHRDKCVWRYPPGEEVYRKDRISVWEVDGRRYKTYSQNLCLLAKFFLDHKTLYYDVEPFLFYIMTINDGCGCHIVGYFSKEKNSFLNFNVSCILTLPPYQRQGYGRLLIEFSYLLTRVEGKSGSPEKPLSDLGLISYRSYWKDVLLDRLCQADGQQVSIKDLSQELGINSYDIVSTLQVLGMMKYWKGKHIIIKNKEIIDEHKEKIKRRPANYKVIDEKCLRWHPPAPVKPSNNPS